MSTEGLNRRVVKLASYRRFSLTGDVRDMSEAELLWGIASGMPDPRAWLERFKAMSEAEQKAELERPVAEAPPHLKPSCRQPVACPTLLFGQPRGLAKMAGV